MKSLQVSVLILAIITFTTDHVCSQDIYASENPLPVGSNVTLSSQSSLTAGTWEHNTDLVVFFYPGMVSISSPWRDRVTFNYTTSELSISSLQLGDSGDYMLQGINFRAQLTLSVQEPISSVTLMANQTNLVEFNDSAVFTCSVSSGSSLSYVWLNGSSEVTANEGVQLSDGNSTLSIVSVTRYDQGPFRCNVSNGISDEISNPVHLNISYGPSDPTMMAMPTKDAYKTGSNITLSCSAESSPSAKIQWFYDGMNLDHVGSQLQLEQVKENQTGSYKCLFHNTVTSRFISVSAVIRIVEPISAVAVIHIGRPPIQNESFTLRCEVTGPVDYIHWWRDGELISTNSTAALIMANNTLTFNPVQHSDNGDYQCHAFNAVSNKTSNLYTVTVNYGPEKPVIMGPSIFLTGRYATFNCSSSSHPASHFSWFFNGSQVANTSELVTGPLTLNMSGKYTCMAYNNVTGHNSTTSKMLTVIAPVTMTSVKIAGAQPILNRTFTLTCGTAGTVESIHWLMDGLPLHADSRRNFSMDNTSVTFYPVLLSDNGYYQCEASNQLSNFTSKNFSLQVVFGPEESIIFGPSVAEEGQHAIFNCSALSWPPSQFSWYFNGSLVATTSVFKTEPLSFNMSGEYTCMAHNNVTGKNTTTSTVLEVIEAIESVMIKSSAIPIESDNLTLTCEVIGPFDSIYWIKDDMRLNMSNSSINSDMSYYIQNNSLHFNPVTRYDNGIYQCVATNLAGQHRSPEFVLLVTYGPLSVNITGPGSVILGSVLVSLTCSADSRPISEYQWFFNDSQMAVETGPVITFWATPQYAGNYTCEARNPVTNITMYQTKVFTVTEDIESVMIKSNTIPIESDNLTLTCEVIGPFDSIYWIKDDMRLNMSNSSINSDMSYYIQNNSLHFNPVTRYDNGIYQCVATNIAGQHWSPDFVLLVTYGPLSVNITGPGSVVLGSVLTVSLTCSADSHPISEYQWFFNDSQMEMNVPVITFLATPQNAGNYTCEARNPVTNITMYQTKVFTVTDHASGLPLQSRGSLVLLALFAVSLPAVSDWLSH